MPITSDEPTTIPSKTYDIWWVRELTIKADDPNGAVRAVATLQKMRSVDGVNEPE